MRKYMIVISALLTGFLSSVEVVSQTTDVLVEKIRYCRTSWPICNDKLKDEYHWWEQHGVPDQIQKNTYIGRYNHPSKQATRHLVFLASGQRFTDGQNNLVTGQPDWEPYSKTKSSHWFSINTDSLAFGLFNRGIYSQADTFVALGFDARFNWGFSLDNKRDIVNAYYSWLKSKVEAHNLQSVYLGGHSRGGALVLRLAEKFQAEFPHVPVIVHAFDPVPNMKEGELGAYNSSIDNPIAGFPRDSGGLDNMGNWSWMSNMHNQFSNKRHLSVYNFLIGGKIFGLAQEVRSVTHETGIAEETELGWYFQRWFSVSENAGGHNGIARSPGVVDIALQHLTNRLQLLRNNVAPAASASASSTYCASPGDHCYSAQRVNDRDMDSRLGGLYSWANSSTSLPQWVQLAWATPIRTRRVDLITSEGYPLQNFDVQYLDGSVWRTLRSVNGNESLRVSLVFPQIQTTAIRVLATMGPNHQPHHVRINEILVQGD